MDAYSQTLELFFLHRAASVGLARNWISYTTTCLIGTDIVREVVIEGAKLIGAVVTHPGTAST